MLWASVFSFTATAAFRESWSQEMEENSQNSAPAAASCLHMMIFIWKDFSCSHFLYVKSKKASYIFYNNKKTVQIIMWKDALLCVIASKFIYVCCCCFFRASCAAFSLIFQTDITKTYTTRMNTNVTRCWSLRRKRENFHFLLFFTFNVCDVAMRVGMEGVENIPLVYRNFSNFKVILYWKTKVCGFNVHKES